MTALDMHMLAAVFLAAQVPAEVLSAGSVASAEDYWIKVVEDYVSARVPGFAVEAHGPEFRLALVGAIKECRLAIRIVAR